MLRRPGARAVRQAGSGTECCAWLTGSGPGRPATLVEMIVRKLLVASQKDDVGKTTTALNLAAAAAQAGGRVLLLDADSVGSVGAALRLPRHTQRSALSEIGIDHQATLFRDVLPRLDVIAP